METNPLFLNSSYSHLRSRPFNLRPNSCLFLSLLLELFEQMLLFGTWPWLIWLVFNSILCFRACKETWFNNGSHFSKFSSGSYDLGIFSQVKAHNKLWLHHGDAKGFKYFHTIKYFHCSWTLTLTRSMSDEMPLCQRCFNPHFKMNTYKL